MNQSEFKIIKKFFESELNDVHLTKENIKRFVAEIIKAGLNTEENEDDLIKEISVYEEKLKELDEKLYETFSEHLWQSSRNASLRFNYTEIYNENKRLVLRLVGLRSTYFKLCELLKITETNSEERDEKMIEKYLPMKE
jgi:6-pyruvoyl-tetrahydropterin synthase